VANFLAIDWDEAECRYALASLRNEKVIVRKVGTAPIASAEGDNHGFVAASHLASLSATIRTFRRDERIGKSPLLVSLGRNEVEWLQQKLPPGKESEIPSLLKNQVLREVAGSTEADPIDYLIYESSYDGHRVLALTISQSYRRSLVRTFRSLGHKPMRIGFRAGNVAELVLQNQKLLEGDATEPRIVVDRVGNDVDLIIIANGRISAIRSFRLPADDQEKNLADEIERTLTIGVDGGNPLPIRHVVLFGDGTEQELPELLSQNGLTVQFLNPFTLPSVVAKNLTGLSEPEKFAPLIGSLLIQARKLKPAIDFLKPKEAPKPPNYLRPVVAALVLLSILCGWLYHWNQGEINALQAELDAVKEEHQRVATKIMELTPTMIVLRGTVAFESQNVVWLDVLKDLSEVLPGDTDLVVTQMEFRTGPVVMVGGRRSVGTITLYGVVRDLSVLRELQYKLDSSGRYRMVLPTPRPNPAGGGYSLSFNTTIYLLR